MCRNCRRLAATTLALTLAWTYEFFALRAKNLLDEPPSDTFKAVRTLGLVDRYYGPPRTYSAERRYAF